MRRAFQARLNIPLLKYWLVVYLPLWKMMDFASWDDFPFPTEWKVIQNSMVPNHNQLVVYNMLLYTSYIHIYIYIIIYYIIYIYPHSHTLAKFVEICWSFNIIQYPHGFNHGLCASRMPVVTLRPANKKGRQNMPSLQAKQLERLIKFDQCLRI